jgi:hypothetical protein
VSLDVAAGRGYQRTTRSSAMNVVDIFGGGDMARNAKGFFSTVVLVLIALTLVSCAAKGTRLQSAYTSPEYKFQPITKILVVGVSNEPIQRRTLEDEFVRQFRAAGDAATASYTVIPENGQAERSLLMRTIEDTGVDTVLITRLVRGTGYTPGWGTWGWANEAKGKDYYDDYAEAWLAHYDVSTVAQADHISLQASLFTVRDSKILWFGLTGVFPPSRFEQDMHGIATDIVGTLHKGRQQ